MSGGMLGGKGRGKGRRPIGGGGSLARLVGGAVVLLGILFVLLILIGARPVAAQGLADFDYENLSLRGLMVDGGYLWSSKVEPTRTLGGRVDLGFLGPGVRIVGGVTHWSSTLVRDEVRTLERKVEELIFEQTGSFTPVDLGTIEWSDLALHADAHMVWRIPKGVLTYAGMGASAHVLRGGGRAIEGTFVEDFLDSVRAGVNAHSGLEIPLHRNFRLVGEARYELLQSLSYVQLRLGGQLFFGSPAAGEMEP